MSNHSKLELIGITTDDNDLTDGEREKQIETYASRANKTLNAKRYSENLEEQRLIVDQLRQMGINPEDIEDKETVVDPNEVGGKLKKKQGPRAALGRIIPLAAGVVLAGVVVVGSIAKQNKGKEEAPIAPVNPVIETIQGGGAEVQEAIGIIDGYDAEGMWTDENKPNTVSFSNFEKVVEMFDGNVKEAIKYVAGNETEAMSDYISGLPAKLRPAGFENLNMAETNDKIENQLSAEEYDQLHQEFNNIIDKADIKETTLNGKYENAYEAVRDGNDLIGSKEALKRGATINHETMQLIQCSTNEKGTKAYQLTWYGEDGSSIGNMTVKERCAQVVEEKGTGRLKGIPEAVEQVLEGGGSITVITGGGPTSDKPTPDNPTPDKPTPDNPTPDKPTPDNPTPPTHPQKNKQAEIKNAGDHVTQMSIDNNVTPPTTIDQDQANFEAMQQLLLEQMAQQAAAAQIADAQAAAEAAAQEAAQTREVANESSSNTPAADESKGSAESGAAADQAEAAEEERAAAEEENTRDDNQNASDSKEDQHSEASDKGHDDTASERANLEY